MSKFLVIGGAGLIGSRVVEALGADQCVRASRNSGERVDISDPKSLAALFDRVGQVDGIVCTGGAARFKPWDQARDDDWAFCLANKLMGQVNVVRYGAKYVRAGGAITLTTGVLAQHPMPGGAMITTVNAAVEAFVRAAVVEPIAVRVNAVSPSVRRLRTATEAPASWRRASRRSRPTSASTPSSCAARRRRISSCRRSI